MPIYLIRHGETALNAARVFQPADTPLSELGHTQARALGQRLRNIHIDAVVTSDLLRTIQTTQGIVEARPPLRLHTSALLQERNLGDLRGQPYEALGGDLLSFKEAPPGGESMAAFEERCRAAFEHIIDLHQDLCNEFEDSQDPSTLDGEAPSLYARNPDDPEGKDPTLVVVTHGLVIRDLMDKYIKRRDGQSLPASIANTSVTIFGASPPHFVELLNCAEHLADAQSSASASTTQAKGSAFGG